MVDFSSMKKKRPCQRCGKIISYEESLNSAAKIRKKLDDTSTLIFDVWFWNYCDDCAENYQEQKHFEKEDSITDGM